MKFFSVPEPDRRFQNSFVERIGLLPATVNNAEEYIKIRAMNTLFCFTAIFSTLAYILSGYYSHYGAPGFLSHFTDSSYMLDIYTALMSLGVGLAVFIAIYYLIFYALHMDTQRYSLFQARDKHKKTFSIKEWIQFGIMPTVILLVGLNLQWSTGFFNSYFNGRNNPIIIILAYPFYSIFVVTTLFLYFGGWLCFVYAVSQQLQVLKSKKN